MKTLLIVGLCVGYLTQNAQAQMSVNADYRERNGLTVASSQIVSVTAKKLRCFATVESVAADPRTALENLKTEKQSIVKAVAAIGVPESTIKFTTVKILEWERNPRNQSYYLSETDGLSPKGDLESYTAISHASFDISLEGVDPDDLTLRPFAICQQLRGHAVFATREIILLFVGELEDTQIKDAKRKAYNEAFIDAKNLASLSSRSLGKLAALTPETDGRWRYWSGPTYSSWYGEDTVKNPLANFSPAENEVWGTDAFKLSRTYTIELRFNIE